MADEIQSYYSAAGRKRSRPRIETCDPDLLTGLGNPPHDAFSARELFDGFMLQQVTANADQEPQFRPLEKVGHEGGDFVFVRTTERNAATE